MQGLFILICLFVLSTLYKNKPLLAIVFFGIITKLVYLVVVQNINPNSVFLADSNGYVRLGENLYNHLIFSQSDDSNLLRPDSMRLPLYPLLISLLYWLDLSVLYLLVFTILLTGICTLFIYQITFKMTGKTKFGLLAASLYCLDPITLYFSNTVLTETLFQFLVLSSIWLMLIPQYKSKYIYAAFTFGLALYLRPVIVLLPILLYTYWAVKNKNSIQSKSIVHLAIAIYLMFPAVWIARNYITFNQPFLSTVLSINLFHHFIPQLLENNEEQVLYNAKYQEIESIETVQEFRLKTQEYYLEAILKKPFKSVLTIANTSLMVLIKPLNAYFDLQLNFKNDRVGINKLFHGHTFTLFMTWLQILIVALFLVSFPFNSFKNDWVIVLSLAAFYFIILSGISVPDARFKIPSTPFFAILTSTGLYNFINWYETKKQA